MRAGARMPASTGGIRRALCRDRDAVQSRGRGIRRRRARGGDAARRSVEVHGNDRRPQRDRRLQPPRWPLRGRRDRRGRGQERADGEAARRVRRAARHDQPPERRPRLLGSAHHAVGLPVDRQGQAVQPAGRIRVPLHGLERGVRRLRPEEPARRRPDDHHRPGRDGPVHRSRRDGLPGPRPVPDRDPLRPREALHADGAPEGVEQQGPDHARGQLRDRPREPGRRPTCSTTRRCPAALR